MVEGVWREVDLGGVPAMVGSRAGVCLAFGLGPPLAAGTIAPGAEVLLPVFEGRVRAIRWCHQVHGRVLATLSEEPGDPFGGSACVGRCDGLLTDEAGVLLAVRTADCVPVLLHGGGVVAAVHAGWRGTAAGIVPAVIRRFLVEYGVDPRELRAVIGPHVGPCHYPVGPEVVEALRSVAGPTG